MSDAETVSELRALLAERDAEIRWLRDALADQSAKAEPWSEGRRLPTPESWSEAMMLSEHFHLKACKIREALSAIRPVGQAELGPISGAWSDKRSLVRGEAGE